MRQAPHSIHAEVCLIGAAIIDPATVLRDVATIVDRHDFYSDRHREVWGAICDLARANGGYVDMALLVARLPQYGDEPVATEVERYITSSPGAAGCPVWAREVKSKARLRSFIEIVSTASEAAYKANAEDTDTVLTESLAAITPACTVSTGVRGLALAEAEAACIDRLRRGQASMIPTGLSAFDGMFDGLPESGTVTVLGYPGSGKSTLALAWCVERAKYQPVRVYQIEMAPERMGATALAQATQLRVHEYLNTGRVPTPGEIAQLERVAADHQVLPLTIAERSASAPTIYAECLQAHAKHGPGCVCVDYLQDLPGWGPFMELVPKITESMRVLSMIARDLGWLVIVVSQLGKEVAKQNRRPGMADGVGSGAIEQRSDLMISVWREHQGEPGQNDERWRLRQRKVEVRSLKNKFGSLGLQYLAFDGPTMTFRSPTPEEADAWNT